MAEEKPETSQKKEDPVKPASAGEATAAPPVPAAKFGQFLAEHNIQSTRLPDSSSVETIEITSGDLISAMFLLKDSAQTQLNFLVSISGVDSPETFDSVYHLRSYFNNDELVIKIRIPKTSIPEGQLPIVPSITTVWSTADWHERESYDLVGIRYVGHPYLRRILNPWDWEGYPLRRNYQQVIDALNNKSTESFR